MCVRAVMPAQGSAAFGSGALTYLRVKGVVQAESRTQTSWGDLGFWAKETLTLILVREDLLQNDAKVGTNVPCTMTRLFPQGACKISAPLPGPRADTIMSPNAHLSWSLPPPEDELDEDAREVTSTSPLMACASPFVRRPSRSSRPTTLPTALLSLRARMHACDCRLDML